MCGRLGLLGDGNSGRAPDAVMKLASAAIPLLLAGLAGAIQTQAPPAPQPFAITVNVDLVVLYATVEGKNGLAVADLREQDFTIHEDGVKQSIRLFRQEDMPVTAGLIVDHSGSMRKKLGDVVIAARAFVKSSSAEDEMFVVNFNDKVTQGLRPGVQFSNQPEELAGAIAHAATEGQTALYDAVAEGLLRVQRGQREKRVLIVISDGTDNASVHTLAQTVRLAVQSNAVVYTIGIFEEDDPDRNPGVLRWLAKETGGKAFFPRERFELAAIGEKIARDIRQQYTLGYFSSGTAPAGTYRKIRVSASGSGHSKLSVRTRAGYITAGAKERAKESGPQ